MSENLPQKYKETIFRKFFARLKEFFFKINEKNKKNDVNITFEEENTLNNKLDYLKVNVKFDNTEFKRKELMKNLSNKPELLENFSNDRLEKILQWYLYENAKKREKLKKVNYNK